MSFAQSIAFSRITSIDIGKHSDPAALVSGYTEGPLFGVDRLSTFRTPRGQNAAPWEEGLLDWIGPQGPDTMTVIDGSGTHRKTALFLANSPRIWGPAVVLQILAGPGTPSDPRILPAVKAEIIEAMLSSLYLVRVPKDLENSEELRLQLAAYRRTNPEAEPHESPRYAAAAGFKDDLLMALAQALWILPRLGRSYIPMANACG